MQTSKCLICNHKLFTEPLLQYKNMPRAAQFLPDIKSLNKDKGINLSIYQCSGCGLVQLSNSPVPYYKEVVRAAAFSEEMKDFRIKQFGKFVQKYSLKGKKIIEIGCGRGEYLSLMKESGARAYGLEYSEKSVQQCIKDGLTASKGFIQNSANKLSNGPFDAFFTLNYLEHLPNPNSTLKGIYNNLTDNAVGLVEVPNFNMIIRNKLFSEFIPDHLFYFTKNTLNTALTLNDFEVIDCKEIWHEYIISAVIRKRKRLDLSDFYRHQEKIKSEIGEYINRFKTKKVAIWGAGHQALAILAMTNIAGKIRYVVDSAAFKQGKYTPATHIPIVSPDKLNSDPVDAVIVMAASYSDEVTRTIRRKFNRNLNIAILRDFGLEIV